MVHFPRRAERQVEDVGGRDSFCACPLRELGDGYGARASVRECRLLSRLSRVQVQAFEEAVPELLSPFRFEENVTNNKTVAASCTFILVELRTSSLPFVQCQRSCLLE